MKVKIERLMEFFFEAMLNGYVVSGPKSVMRELPGNKMFRYKSKDGKLLLIDQYCVGEKEENSFEEYSFGSTIIYYIEDEKPIPVWYMNYGGWYNKEVIYLLKKVLKEAYSKKIFIGGRGESCLDNKLIYENDYKGNFRGFTGMDNIYGSKYEHYGGYQYFGSTMF